MCRLLGISSIGVAPIASLLHADHLDGFTGLSRKHADGWGMAAWDSAETPVVHRELVPAWTSASYRRVLEATHCSQVIIHTRLASAGMPVVPENLHPFVRDNAAFAHNGHFPGSERVADLVRAATGESPRGGTDSELYFLLIRGLARTRDWAEALLTAAAEIERLTRASTGRAPESMNCLLGTPEALYALCLYDADAVAPTSPADVYDMRLHRHQDSMIVSSTGFPVADTQLLPLGRVLRIERRTRHLSWTG